MRINNVVGFSSQSCIVNNYRGRDISFERRLKENEKAKIAADINSGFDILGKQVRALIIHGPNFPASKFGLDQGMGSPYGQRDFENFVKTFGINYIQLGPVGARNYNQRSHYLSSIYEKDPALINFNLLSGNDYANILPKDKLHQIVRNGAKEIPDSDEIKKGSNYTRSNFERAEAVADEALLAAYINYNKRCLTQDKTIKKFDAEFKAFKGAPENSWLDDYAVLHMIATNKYYGDDWYMGWSKNDQELISLKNNGDPDAIAEFNAIKEKYSGEINLYKFGQFIASKQAKVDKETSDIYKISDRIVSQSSFDILTNKDIFLDNWCIGAKGGGYKGTPQMWGTPLINPRMLFNPDGSLGKGGEYLKRKFQSALDGVDMIRVDHVFAYANPFVYRRSFAQNYDNWNMDVVDGKEIYYIKTENLKGNAGFLLDKKLEWDKDGEYASNLDIPAKEKYRRIIPEIIIPALIEKGFDKSDIDKIAWETLGDWNPVFSLEIRPQLKLNGMHSLRYLSGNHTELGPHDYALIGTHDDPPVQYLVKHPELGNNNVWAADYLAKFLKHSKTAPKDLDNFFNAKKITNQDLVKAKYVDLFTSKTDKLAINFIDFFGIDEQQNVPGTNDEERPENWTVRLPSDYDENYYKELSDYKHKYAINVPEILRMSIENKLDAGEIPANKINEAHQLIKRLSHWEDILKEPEK